MKSPINKSLLKQTPLKNMVIAYMSNNKYYFIYE